MMKPSKQWAEFGQLIDIIDIRIGKQQRKLVKLKNQLQELIAQVNEKWEDIEQEQIKLKGVYVMDEHNALARFFLRRESIKSNIESLFFDASIMQQNTDNVALEIELTEAKKKKLERRKDALGELRELIKYKEE